jgi:hypothetical protein
MLCIYIKHLNSQKCPYVKSNKKKKKKKKRKKKEKKKKKKKKKIRVVEPLSNGQMGASGQNYI